MPDYDADYGVLFGKDVARSLGLVPRLRDSEAQARAVVAYRENPAEAFTQAAAFAQPPGDANPVPFACLVTLTDGPILDPPPHLTTPTSHAREPRPA